MFGGFGKNTSSNDSDSKIDGVQTKKTEKSQSSVNHGFDPDSLERAAKAARELDSSKNAQGNISVLVSHCIKLFELSHQLMDNMSLFQRCYSYYPRARSNEAKAK